MDEDASSIVSSNASFEDIGPTTRYMGNGEHKPLEVRTVDRLKALVAKSAATTARDIPEGEVPDVIYTLQYKERFGGKVTEREYISILKLFLVAASFSITSVENRDTSSLSRHGLCLCSC